MLSVRTVREIILIPRLFASAIASSRMCCATPVPQYSFLTAIPISARCLRRSLFCIRISHEPHMLSSFAAITEKDPELFRLLIKSRSSSTVNDSASLAEHARLSVSEVTDWKNSRYAGASFSLNSYLHSVAEKPHLKRSIAV